MKKALCIAWAVLLGLYRLGKAYVRDGDGLVKVGITKILEHVLDQERSLSNLLVFRGC